MTKNKKITAGIVGLGVGEKHAQVYAAHAGVEHCVVTDLDHARATRVAGSQPRTSVVKTFEEIINDPAISIVSIASYDNAHAVQIMKALSAGKHVFVEKPLCLSVSEAVKIRTVLKKNKGVRLSSNLPLRACPRFIAVKDEIASGRCGDIYALRADYLWGRVEKLISGWRCAMPFYSIIYGASVHMIDLVLWLTERRPVVVKASGGQVATRGTALRFNDFASIQLVFDDGMIVESSAHGGCVHPHFHRLEVYGTKKTFLQGLTGANWVTSSDGTGNVEVAQGAYPAKETRGDVLRSFLDVLCGTADSPMVTEEDVFATISVCFAAEESVRTGRTVKIKYI